MNFKKDYINYVLYNVINSGVSAYGFPAQAGRQTGGAEPIVFIDNIRIRKILEKIINSDDIFKITYFVGKTAGLDLLYKYLLYISDKIDKSQITVFNLKDNFDYDVINLKKICEKIEKYTPEESSKELEKSKEKEEAVVEAEKPSKPVSTIKIDVEKESEIISTPEEQAEQEYAETTETEEPGLTLIENKNAEASGNEVFELTEIDEIEDKDEHIGEDKEKTTADILSDEEEDKILVENDETIEPEDDSIIPEEKEDEEINITEEEKKTEIETAYKPEQEEELTEEVKNEEKLKPDKKKVEFEFEVKKPSYIKDEIKQTEHVKEEAVTNEAYLKFENRFFEDVKILEKLFERIGKENKQATVTTLNDKMLQSFMEIIEISSELADLTRQLSFDLTADIFYTINIFFTKAIKNLSLLTYDRIKLLESSLALITSLIKGEDYLNYDIIVEKIEKLKDELSRPSEKKAELDVKQERREEAYKEVSPKEEIPVIKEKVPVEHKKEIEITEPRKSDVVYQYERPKPEDKPAEEIKKTEERIAAKQVIREQPVRTQQPAGDMDSVLFKMKHFVREFEKTFISLGNIKGEYSKFDALEKIDDLNNWLRMIARISSSVKMKDSLKLAEVSYVFLKYVKDYRMDLMDSEIQQILKYIIFTFKMLLTDRRPEDFNVLVQYLNNPVQIFTD